MTSPMGEQIKLEPTASYAALRHSFVAASGETALIPGRAIPLSLMGSGARPLAANHLGDLLLPFQLPTDEH